MRTVVQQYRLYMRRNPLLASLASIVLAVGFAGSALAYTVMRAMSSPSPVGLRSLQYATIAEETGGGGSQSVAWKTYQRLRESPGRPHLALFAYAEPIRAKLHLGETGIGISVAAVSSGFFSDFVEGLDAGRDFSAVDNGHGSELILTRHLAERLFATPADALDRSVVINGQAFRVIGVAAGGFSGLWSATDAWVAPSQIVSLDFGALSEEPHGAEKHSSASNGAELWQKFPIFYVLAGSSNASLERMRKELGDLVRSSENLPDHLHVTDGLSKDPIWDAKIRFWARLALVLSMALIFAAGLNYCGLLLAQVPRYVEEVRLKRVLGASVLRIVFESMCGPVATVLLGFLLATGGAMAGIWALGKHGTDLLRSGGIRWVASFDILAIELAIAFLLGLLIALVPSLRLLRDSGAPRMGYTTTASRKTNLALSAIVAGQLASCILISLIAATIIGAVHSASRVELGFDSDHLAAIEIGPATKNAPIEFSTAGSREFPLAAFTRQVLETVQEKRPEVQRISASSCAPLQRMRTISIQRLDRDLPPHSVHFCGVSQGFFQTMGNPIVAGRGFSDHVLIGNVSEVVINRRLADQLWPGEDPLHHVVRVEEPAWELQFVAEVVGVSQDMRFVALTSTPDATVFLPLRGNVFTLSLPLYFLARGMEPLRPVEEVARLQAAISMPSLGVNSSYRVDEQLRQSFTEQKARVWFAATGAAFVALIAYIGLYGVLVHSVNAKRKEMAIRLCFGASAGGLRKIIIRQALQCSVTAIAISMLTWRPITLLASGAWLGKVELGWPVAVGVPLLCVAAALAISLVPASAAAKLSPAGVLKEQ